MTASKSSKAETHPDTAPVAAPVTASTATVEVTPEGTGTKPPSENPPAQASALQVRPDTPSAIVSTFRVAGDRPVYAGTLAISETYSIAGSLRPVQASRQRVVEMMGDRPIMASGLDIRETFHSSGVRPIAAASLAITESYRAMGDRPVASNQIDNPALLMGFLD